MNNTPDPNSKTYARRVEVLRVLHSIPQMAELVAPCAIGAADKVQIPSVDGVMTFYGGSINPWTGEVVDVESPIFSEETGKKVVIGRLSQMGEVDGACDVIQWQLSLL